MNIIQHVQYRWNILEIISELCNAVVTCEIKLFQPSSMSVSNNFTPVRGILPEIISKLSPRLIGAHEYFPTSISK